jgi:hypothetical protein
MEVDPQGFEVEKPRIPYRIREPNKEELDDHLATGHAAYRAWCPHCVKSKGQANPHREQPGSEQPEVHFDYGYLGFRDSPPTALHYGTRYDYGCVR